MGFYRTVTHKTIGISVFFLILLFNIKFIKD